MRGLIEAGISFRKTHDLGVLLDLVSDPKPSWEDLRPALDVLTSLGIEVRYPGASADAEDAVEAQRTAAKVRALIRQTFGLGSTD